MTEPGKSLSQPIQTLFWRRVEGIGLERFELARTADAWVLRGVILAMAGNADPTEARYKVVCDEAWRTRRADISVRDSAGERALQVVAEDGHWYQSGSLIESVSGCIDIDLEWSPSTNSIPIRRLRLGVGQKSSVITAAWVRFPALTLEPLPQEYQRLAEQRYRYSSRGGAFVAELSVEDNGVVLDYGEIWQRV